MSTYNTEQKKQLIDFMTRHAQTAFSAEQAAQEMESELGENAPGKSTVYRLLSRLCDEGKVKRFSQRGERQSYYQIVAGKHCDRHFHLKCTRCGRLLHMSDEESEKLVSEILSASDFLIDRENTVLYGVCAKCAQEWRLP